MHVSLKTEMKVLVDFSFSWDELKTYKGFSAFSRRQENFLLFLIGTFILFLQINHWFTDDLAGKARLQTHRRIHGWQDGRSLLIQSLAMQAEETEEGETGMWPVFVSETLFTSD